MFRSPIDVNYASIARRYLVFIIFFEITLLYTLWPYPVLAAGTTYYVDPQGSDTNAGTSEASAWKSLGKVNGFPFQPGDQVLFKRGGMWSGGLTISRSGLSNNPIIFGAYGSGVAPIIENPAGQWSNVITLNADYTVIENLTIRNTGDSGIRFNQGADHNTIRNNEITNVGVGSRVYGQYNLITGNYIHDLKMVVNTPGGDDDQGAVGIWLFNGKNEIAGNRIINAKAKSYDYGDDGGTVEIWANSGVSVDDNYIHHNFAQNNDGFMEIGGRGGSARNNVIAYNVIVNVGKILGVHVGGTFATPTQGMRLENNTIIGSGGAFQFWRGEPQPGILNLRNNIFSGFSSIGHAGAIAHSYNLYSSTPNFGLGTGEIVADPKFVNLTAGDFHLTSGSPAINAGTNLNYTRDFENHPVPQGSAPDMGVYEFGGSGPQPTPTPTSSLVHTPTPTPVPAFPGDLDRDGDIDIYDYNRLVSDFGKVGSPGFTPSDIDKNGKVDIYDYNTLVENFGRAL